MQHVFILCLMRMHSAKIFSYLLCTYVMYLHSVCLLCSVLQLLYCIYLKNFGLLLVKTNEGFMFEAHATIVFVEGGSE